MFKDDKHELNDVHCTEWLLISLKREKIFILVEVKVIHDCFFLIIYNPKSLSVEVVHHSINKRKLKLYRMWTWYKKDQSSIKMGRGTVKKWSVVRLIEI